VAETVDARKVRIDANDALKLLDGIERLIAARGKKVEVFDLRKNRPDDRELLARMMGPTGNLRAPTARIGTTLVVGFNEEAYREVLG
jgi:arsenate reductase-like glutaredoxin family protein